MYAIDRSLRFIRGALLTYGPSSVKKWIWDKEYSGDKWDFAYHTVGDCVYPYLEKYSKGGSILDLGCGSGNTATELKADAYAEYLGVDVSEICLQKARKRSELAGRSGKNSFVKGDFLNYEPPTKFDVVLFRESLYHVPMHRIPATLRRYSRYLTDGGVFIVRLISFNQGKKLDRPKAMLRAIEKQFSVVGLGEHTVRRSKVALLVFRPRRSQELHPHPKLSHGGGEGKTTDEPSPNPVARA